MEICYLVTRQDALRGNLHILVGRPSLWPSVMLLPAFFTGLIYWQYPSVQASLHLYRKSAKGPWL